MKVRITTSNNVTDSDLATALAGLAKQEGVVHEVHEMLGRLVKSDSKHEEDEIPERYMRYIADQLSNEFKSLLMTLVENIDTWIDYQSRARRSVFKSLRKATDDIPPVLTQEQLDELSSLIEYMFRSAIGVHFTASPDQIKAWQKMGIKDPNVHLDQWITRAYVAGRIADLLTNNTSYDDMMKLAKKLTMSRSDKLILEMSKLNAARFIKGYAQKLGGIATDVALDQHKKSINSVIQRYFSGDLKTSVHPESGFSPEEAGVVRDVTSWKQLASELRNRFKQTDLVRDWDRVAFTEMRYATNLGRIMNIQHEGGGDAEDIEVFYHVLPTACNACKKLYLEADQKTPKIFKLSEIMRNVDETGGMNIGRKASTIGGADGWLPNAVTHPHCHCFPVRKISGYKYAEFE